MNNNPGIVRIFDLEEIRDILTKNNLPHLKIKNRIVNKEEELILFEDDLYDEGIYIQLLKGDKSPYGTRLKLYKFTKAQADLNHQFEHIDTKNGDKKTLRWKFKLEELGEPVFDDIDEEAGNYPDAAISEMTIRDFYCIIRNVPASNKNWLNHLLNQKEKTPITSKLKTETK